MGRDQATRDRGPRQASGKPRTRTADAIRCSPVIKHIVATWFGGQKSANFEIRGNAGLGISTRIICACGRELVKTLKNDGRFR